MAEQPRYVPAAGREALTPLYDAAMRLTMREGLFRPRLVGQALAGLGEGACILEIGCGTGALTGLLAQAAPAGAALTGLDGDERVLARARARLEGSGVELVVSGAQRLPFEDGSFDRVVASLLLHHLDDATKAAALAEAHRVLVRGGSLHVADWGRPAGALPRLGFAALRALDGRENTRGHAEGRLAELIGAAGFAPVEPRGRLATAWGTLELIAADKGVDFA